MITILDHDLEIHHLHNVEIDQNHTVFQAMKDKVVRFKHVTSLYKSRCLELKMAIQSLQEYCNHENENYFCILCGKNLNPKIDGVISILDSNLRFYFIGGFNINKEHPVFQAMQDKVERFNNVTFLYELECSRLRKDILNLQMYCSHEIHDKYTCFLCGRYIK